MKLFKSLTEIKTHSVHGEEWEAIQGKINNLGHDEYMAVNEEDGKVYLNSKYVGDMEVKK